MLVFYYLLFPYIYHTHLNIYQQTIHKRYINLCMTCLFWSELIKCTWFNGLTDYNWGVRAANTTQRSPSGWGYDHWWQSLKFWLWSNISNREVNIFERCKFKRKYHCTPIFSSFFVGSFFVCLWMNVVVISL